MLYHGRGRKNKENANFVHIVYLFAKLCIIFDEAFFIDVSLNDWNILRVTKHYMDFSHNLTTVQISADDKLD